MIRSLLAAFAVLFCSLGAPLEAHAYTTTTCLHGETGTCRLATCGSDIQAAINASSSGGSGYVSPTQFNGDAVYIQSCSLTNVGTITISDKNIHIRGASDCTVNDSDRPTSCGTQISGNFRINVTDAGGRKAAFRISHLRLDATSGVIINFNGGNPHSTAAIAGYYRVDHLLINRSCGANGIQGYGVIFGLYDSNTINQSVSCGNPLIQQSEYLNNEYGVAPTKFLGEWAALMYTPRGTINNMVWENNRISFTASSGICPLRDSESGPGHFVFRYNEVTSSGCYVYFYAHWSRANEWDGAWVEIYRNKMSCSGGGCGGYPIRLESGTGVIYDNQFSGWSTNTVVVDEGRGCGGSNNPQMYQCNGTRAWDMNAGDANAPGWPCASQIGVGCLQPGGCSRGNQDNIPLILWNNGPQATCATGGACTNSLTVNVVNQHGDAAETCVRPTSNYIKSSPHTATNPKFNGAVDFCQGSTKPATCGTYTNDYVPLVYPHPMRGSSAPDKPTNFRVVEVPALDIDYTGFIEAATR